MLKPLEHPLTIFVSYEHSQEAICRKIIEVLMARGHLVWFDGEMVHPGEDWRRQLERGIEGSQAVLFCLSRRAVCDPGVCLDALNIAARVKGGNILTVLLEPEREVNPPAAACCLQWLDMSDWRERLGAPDFDAWFEGKMSQLNEAVERL